MISGSAIFPELLTVTFNGIRSSIIFLHADTPDPTTLIPISSEYFYYFILLSF